MTDALRHGLLWGLLLAAYLSVAFVWLAWRNAEMWLGDYPPDIQAAFGHMSRRASKQRLWLGIPVLALALGIVAFATIDFVRGGGSVGFPAATLHTFVLLMVFNLVDLLLIDWLLFVRIRPDFVVLPGTEGLEGYGSYRFHWRAFLKGTAGVAVASLLVGAAVVVVT